MSQVKRKAVSSAIVTALTAPLALMALTAGPASADPVCDVPIPPPVCGVDPPDPEPTPTPPSRVRGDFDGDKKADLTVYRPSTGTWYTIGSKTGAALPAVQFGNIGADSNTPMPGHFTSDGLSDHGVFSRYSISTVSFGKYLWRSSTTGNTLLGPDADFSASPVPGDYDGNGREEPAHFDWSGTWNVPGFPDRNWGTYGDVAVPGDYDKDKKTDLAVWRPSNGTWYVIKSSNGAVVTRQWGQVGDIPVPGDYDRDGKTDFAVWRPSTGIWHMINSSTNTSWWAGWGQKGDVPVALDYSGDRKTDFAVWRPSNGTWYVWPNGASSSWSRQWGQAGDHPIR